MDRLDQQVGEVGDLADVVDEKDNNKSGEDQAKVRVGVGMRSMHIDDEYRGAAVVEISEINYYLIHADGGSIRREEDQERRTG